MRTQYEIQITTQFRKNQKVVRTNNDVLLDKSYPKKKPLVQQQSKNNRPTCLSCEGKKKLEFDKGWQCQNCEFFIYEQKHQIDKKELSQDHCFSTRLPYAKKMEKVLFLC